MILKYVCEWVNVIAESMLLLKWCSGMFSITASILYLLLRLGTFVTSDDVCL